MVDKVRSPEDEARFRAEVERVRSEFARIYERHSRSAPKPTVETLLDRISTPRRRDEQETLVETACELSRS